MLPELLNGGKLNQALRMGDGSNSADCRREDGKQTVAMGDAAATFTLGGTSVTGEVRLAANIINIDPESSGAGENATMPATANWRGPYTFYNSGDEDVYFLDASASAIVTLKPGQHVTLRSDGTMIFVEQAVIETARSWYNAPGAEQILYIAPQPVTVTAITGRVGTPGSDGGAVTATIYKAASGTAPGSGSALHTGTYNLKGTADTNQNLALHGTAANLQLDAGDAIVMVSTGTTTAADGMVSVQVLPR